MEAKKGFKELILASDILKNKKNIDFQLLLGGNIVEKKDLEKLIEEKNYKMFVNLWIMFMIRTIFTVN